MDTDVDPANCGSCGTACAPGEVCSQGGCALTCGAGTEACDGVCVDTDVDPRNCGTCDNTCGAGEVCWNGVCGLVCPGGTTECSGSCVNTDVDPANCGSCGNACDGDEVCSGGVCSVTCGGGTTACSGACVDTNLDPANCGSCGNVCDAGRVCSGGVCTLNCGGGTTNCLGMCVDTDHDPEHCGGCGLACDPGEVCVSGSCEPLCDSGETNCSGACVDLSSDTDNCGACGQACGTGEPCVMGQCEPTLQFLVNERNASTVWLWKPGETPTTYHSTTANDADCNTSEGSSFGWVVEHFDDKFGRFVPGSGTGLDAEYSFPAAFPKHVTVFNGEIVIMHRNDATIYRYNEGGTLIGTVPTGNGTGQGLATDGTNLYASFWNGTSSYFVRYDASFASQETIANPTGMGSNTNLFDFAYDRASGRFYGLATDSEGGTGTNSSTVVEFEMGGAVIATHTLPVSADGIGQAYCF